MNIITVYLPVCLDSFDKIYIKRIKEGHSSFFQDSQIFREVSMMNL